MNTLLPLSSAFRTALSGGTVVAMFLGAGIFFAGGGDGGLPSAKAASASVSANADANAKEIQGSKDIKVSKGLKESKDSKGSKTETTPVSEPPLALPAPPDFSYILTRWQPERDFKRISEYFTGREDTGGDAIVRSDAANRSGMYFRIGFPLGKTFPAGSVLLVEYIRGDSPGTHTHSFELPPLTRWPFAELCIGLTGKDWPGKPDKLNEQDENLRLVAWRLTLKDAGGTVLFRRHSFLWELPPPPAPSAADVNASATGVANATTATKDSAENVPKTENTEKAKP
jgi:hypothetical protein